MRRFEKNLGALHATIDIVQCSSHKGHCVSSLCKRSTTYKAIVADAMGRPVYHRGSDSILILATSETTLGETLIPTGAWQVLALFNWSV